MMSKIIHHVPEAMMTAYAAGTLPRAYSVAVASHVSMCTKCRSALDAQNTVGGVVLEDVAGIHVSEGLRDQVLLELERPAPVEPTFVRSGIYPGPVMAELKGRAIKWSRVGKGVCQDILSRDDSGTVRLLKIPPGQAVPDHSHRGIEMTLVLKGSFSDETGRYGVGDIEIADEDLAHTPIADPECECICLAVTDAPLSFREFFPRLFQPMARI